MDKIREEQFTNSCQKEDSRRSWAPKIRERFHIPQKVSDKIQEGPNANWLNRAYPYPALWRM